MPDFADAANSAGPVITLIPSSSDPTLRVAAPAVVKRSGATTRALAVVALGLLGTGLVGGARALYRVATDSFVAPMILSGDSDLVVESKAKLTGLEMDRIHTVGEVEGIEAELASTREGIARLTELRTVAKTALEWTRTLTAQRRSAGSADLETLRRQEAVLAQILSQQGVMAGRARDNLGSGLITATDYEKEQLALHQTQLALLENSRTRVQASLTMQQIKMAEGSLSGRSDAATMPEVLAAEDLLLRIELELSKLQAEERTKVAERRATSERLAKLDELEQQLKSRPIFQAIDKNLEVGFVPYTQLDGVGPGARVYSCFLGLVLCKEVGKVAEVMAGEVLLSDPWGNPARGQYAVLDLADPSAAKAKSLRVRRGGAPAEAHKSIARVAPLATPTAPSPMPTEIVAAPQTPAPPPPASDKVEPLPGTVSKVTGELVLPASNGHRVFVDGQLTGTAPGTFRVKCGSHAVTIGANAVPREIAVPCGGKVEVKS